MSKERTKDYNFAKRASAYDEGPEGKMSGKFYNLLLREMEISPGMEVLDAGCGTGALLKKLTGSHKIKAYGIDVEEKMLSEARKKCPEIDFQISRCDKTPFSDKQFDIIIACLSYHHFDNRAGFTKEAGRIIKPGGVLYIAEPRFPWLFRKTINGIFALAGLVGQFYTFKEIESHFSKTGFSGAGYAFDSYAQVVKLRKGE